MNIFHRLCAAVALTLVLTLPAFADGGMHTGPGAAPPTSATASAGAGAGVTRGHIECGRTQGDMSAGVGPAPGDEAAAVSIIGVVSGLLRSLLALL